MWSKIRGSGKKDNEKPKELTLDEKVENVEEKVKRVDAQLVRLKKILAGPGSASEKEGIRQQALGLLRQRKLYQNHLNNLNQHSYNLDRVNLTKESYKTVLSTYSSLKTSHKELKSISRKVDQSKIEDLKDQIEDLVEKSEDIANIIGNVQDEYVDEDELNQELEMLNDEFNVVPAYHDRVSIAQGSEKKEENEPSEVELSQMMSELEKPKEEEQPGLVK